MTRSKACGFRYNPAMPANPFLPANGAATPAAQVVSVSELNRMARELLESALPLMWVGGEISNLVRAASGHVYFTLKDAGAQVRCALFRSSAARVRQALRDGLAVRVRGKVSLFEGRGDYQLILDTVEPAGDGALRLAFEARKPHSLIFWGPPGVGKTTLARLMADAFEADFIALSAVLSGVKEIRESIARAERPAPSVLAAKAS